MLKRDVHPGAILKDEFNGLGITPTAFARRIDVPPNRMGQIIGGKRAITGDTALRLGHWFGVDPQVWLNLQSQFDRAVAQRETAPPSATCRHAKGRLICKRQTRAIRAAGMTQARFAETYEFSLRTVQEWERGAKTPSGPARTLPRAIRGDAEGVRRALAVVYKAERR